MRSKHLKPKHSRMAGAPQAYPHRFNAEYGHISQWFAGVPSKHPTRASNISNVKVWDKLGVEHAHKFAG